MEVKETLFLFEFNLCLSWGDWCQFRAERPHFVSKKVVFFSAHRLFCHTPVFHSKHTAHEVEQTFLNDMVKRFLIAGAFPVRDCFFPTVKECFFSEFSTTKHYCLLK